MNTRSLIPKIIITIITLSYTNLLHASQMTISEPWLRPASTQMHSSAMYMELTNDSEHSDALYKVESPAAQIIELHETIEAENGVSRMQHVENITLTPHNTVSLKPGGMHIMFIKLNNDLNENDTVPVTLFFKSHEKINLEVPVKGYNSLAKDKPCGCKH